MRRKILIFFGAPGSGKGTMADMLGEELKMPVISPGELLRAEKNSPSSLSKEMVENMKSGKLVDNNFVEKIIDKRLAKGDTSDGYILDGYPRSMEQLELFKERISRDNDKNCLILAILIEVRDDVVLERISGRLVCDCGESYHTTFNPPKKPGICDNCGKKLYQRDDDAIDVVKTRLKNYHKRIKPMLDYFGEFYKIIKINGEQPINKEKQEMITKLKKFL